MTDPIYDAPAFPTVKDQLNFLTGKIDTCQGNPGLSRLEFVALKIFTGPGHPIDVEKADGHCADDRAEWAFECARIFLDKAQKERGTGV